MARSKITRDIIRVIRFNDSYTLQANTARIVTVTPAQLGLSGGIEILSIDITSEHARYNNWFIDNSPYIAGVGIQIRLFSLTARTERIYVTVTYRQISD